MTEAEKENESPEQEAAENESVPVITEITSVQDLRDVLAGRKRVKFADDMESEQEDAAESADVE